VDIEKRINSLIKEAEIYRTQGLFDEAKTQLDSAATLVSENKDINNADNLLALIKKQKETLKKDIEKVETATRAPEMSQDFQEVVKEQFIFSEDEDTAALEGAIALVQFGQFKRALNDLIPLLEKKDVRFVAAKNILRCYIALDSVETAQKTYDKWCSDRRFTKQELDQLGVFLKKHIEEKSAKKNAENRMNLGLNAGAKRPVKFDIPEVYSVEIQMDEAGTDGSMLDFKVISQSGNRIQFLFPLSDVANTDILKPGNIFDEIRCYSQKCLFICNAVVRSSAKTDTGSADSTEYKIEIEVS